MPSRRLFKLGGTLTPFLYPSLLKEQCSGARWILHRQTAQPLRQQRRQASTDAGSGSYDAEEPIENRLDPSPDSYALTPFTDRCELSIHAGSGGHGCVSFTREKYIEHGPPNGGDGGYGGNIYIQATRGESSLHKISRRRIIAAERGRNGQGKTKGGEKGDDVLIEVPVGTVVREIWRHDPVADAERELWLEENGDLSDGQTTGAWKKDRWLLYPGIPASKIAMMPFPELPRPRRSHLAAAEARSPLRLDLDRPMDRPMLLAAGAVGGLGNQHFESKEIPRPKMATKGEQGVKISVQMELKLLADLALVGLPNAGKSTLIRAISNSRARVGNWAFTTLQPNIGTVVLDDHRGRPKLILREKDGSLRTSFTIADIPGLVEDAHLNKGLGLGFLRHVERAAVLAFVVDLSAGDAITALDGLWKEVAEYELHREREVQAESQRTVRWKPSNFPVSDPLELSPNDVEPLPPLALPPLSSKPWFVVATKADLPETQENFASLQTYLKAIESDAKPHPSRKENAWKKRLYGIPISAIRAEGVDRIAEVVVEHLQP